MDYLLGFIGGISLGIYIGTNEKVRWLLNIRALKRQVEQAHKEVATIYSIGHYAVRESITKERVKNGDNRV